MKTPERVFKRRLSMACEYVACQDLYRHCENQVNDWQHQIARGVDLSVDAVEALKGLMEDVRVRMRYLLTQMDSDPFLVCPDYPPAPLPQGWV